MLLNRSFRRAAIRSLALAVLCSGALVVVADQAAAGPVGLGLDYTCATSPGRGLSVHVEVRGGLPEDVSPSADSVPYGERAHVDVDLAITADTSALGSAAVRIDGDSTATLAASFVGPRSTQGAEAALTFAPTLVTRTPGVLRAAGGFPGLYLRDSGDHAIHLGDLTVSLRPERADGTPLGAVTATCVQAPGQVDRLGVVKSESVIIERPVRPTELRVTATTPTSVSLSWYATPWWFQTWGYDVYLDDVKAAFVTDKSATLTGLRPDTQHRVKIVTKDVGGFSSAKSQGLVFATPPAP